MELRYDPTVDAAFVYVAGQIVPGTIDFTDELDQDRNVKNDADDRVLAYEFLSVRRLGVKLDDLEHRDELRALFRDAGFRERDAGASLSTMRRVGGRRITG